MKKWRYLLAAVTILGVSGVASAATFWDDFEAYTAGSNAHGQGGWKGFNNIASAAGVVSTKYAFSGKNSLEVRGSDQIHEFDLTGGRFVISLKQYVPAGSTGIATFCLLDRYRDGTGNTTQDRVNGNWAVQMAFSLDSGDIDTTAGTTSPGTIVYDQWVELKYVIDLAKNMVQEYYGGKLILAGAWSDGTVDNTFQAVELFATPDSCVYYDDIRIEPFYDFEAWGPDPADGAVGVMFPLLHWTAGDRALCHDVYLGTAAELTEADKVSARKRDATYLHRPEFQQGVTYYWRVDEVEVDGTVHPGKVWSFTAMPLTACGPGPADGSKDAAQATVLTWLPPLSAIEHHLYFSDNRDAVEKGEASPDKGVVAETTFRTGLLHAGTTYFWRVDEKYDTGEVMTGPIWSFTTMSPVLGKVVREWWSNIPGSWVSNLRDDARYPANPSGCELVESWEGPVNWNCLYGSRMYGWLIPPKSGDYTFWIASDDNSELWLSTDSDPANGRLIATVVGWAASRDFDHASGTGCTCQRSAAIPLQAGKLYYMEALLKQGSGGDNIAVAWQPPGADRDIIPGSATQTFVPPLAAAATPSSGDGTSDVVQNPVPGSYDAEDAQRH